MKTILRGLRIGLSAIFQGITLAGVLLFALPPWICCGRLYLLPITVLLSPLMLIGGALMIFCGAIGNWTAYGLYKEDAKTGRLLENGVEILDPTQSSPTFVAWAELNNITSIAYPLIIEHRLEYKNGGRTILASIDAQNNEPQVPWAGKNKALSWLDVEDS